MFLWIAIFVDSNTSSDSELFMIINTKKYIANYVKVVMLVLEV